MNILKTIAKMFLMLVSGILIGTGLLWLAFMIPEKNIYKNGGASLKTFASEGLYPAVGNSQAEKLDNWTDSLMVLLAMYEKKDATPLNRAMAVYQPVILSEDADPVTVSCAYVNGSDNMGDFGYSRYWHGYLTVLRPLLSVTSYNGIRAFNNIGVILMLLIVLGALIWKKYYHVIVPLLLTFLFLRPLAIMFSLQFSTVYYPTMLTILFLTLLGSKLEHHNHYLFLFLLDGMLIGYLDLLTYPVAALGIPLAVFLSISKGPAFLEQCKRVIISSVAWGFGYFGIWAGKWLIGSIILKRSIIADATEQAKFRLSTNTGSVDFSRIDVYLRNIGIAFSGIQIIAIIILIFSVLYLLWKAKENYSAMVHNVVPYLLVLLIPFIWYSVLANHSYIHVFFTYRDLAAVVCSLECMCFTCGLPKDAKSVK